MCDSDPQYNDSAMHQETVMETFTLGLGNRWWFRAFSRNPLVRHSDRIEVLVLCMAVVASIVALPIATTIGTSVREARTHFYTEQAKSRHEVTATAIEDGSVQFEPNHVSYTVQARWRAGGRDHVGAVDWPDRVKSGDQLSIWVNDAGNDVGPPMPPSRADSDAVAAGFAFWFFVTAASAGFAYLVRRRLDHWRSVQWDREISASRDIDGQTNRQ